MLDRSPFFPLLRSKEVWSTNVKEINQRQFLLAPKSEIPLTEELAGDREWSETAGPIHVDEDFRFLGSSVFVAESATRNGVQSLQEKNKKLTSSIASFQTSLLLNDAASIRCATSKESLSTFPNLELLAPSRRGDKCPFSPPPLHLAKVRAHSREKRPIKSYSNFDWM